jgi:ADP-glucose pyrophosphorylase
MPINTYYFIPYSSSNRLLLSHVPSLVYFSGYTNVSMNNYIFIPELLVKIYYESLSLPKGCDLFLKQVAEIIYDEQQSYIHDYTDSRSYQKPIYKILVEYYCKYNDETELRKYFKKALAKKLYTESEIKENNCLKGLNLVK